MAILELKAEIPDLFESIEKALSEQEFGLKGTTFHNGVFVLPNGRLNSILGYDSSVRLKLAYAPTEEIPDFDNPENIKIAPVPHVEILGCNYDIHKVNRELVGKIKFSQDNPLVLDVVVSSDHLKAPPYDEKYITKIAKSKTSEEVADIVKNIGLEDKRKANDKERKYFRFEDMLLLLEWIKLNMKYSRHKKDYLEVLRDREGVCAEFSEIFERMVYVAGGLAFHIGGDNNQTFNLPLEGWSYFSLNSEPIVSHALTGVYYGNRWHIVDPTIYHSTYHNPQIPEGHEKRAYSPKIKNYHIVDIIPPKIEFLDRNLSELEKLKFEIMIEKDKNPYPYKTLGAPKVDKASIQLLK